MSPKKIDEPSGAVLYIPPGVPIPEDLTTLDDDGTARLTEAGATFLAEHREKIIDISCHRMGQ